MEGLSKAYLAIDRLHANASIRMASTNTEVIREEEDLPAIYLTPARHRVPIANDVRIMRAYFDDTHAGVNDTKSPVFSSTTVVTTDILFAL